jgi:hypothetical protein
MKEFFNCFIFVERENESKSHYNVVYCLTASPWLGKTIFIFTFFSDSG